MRSGLGATQRSVGADICRRPLMQVALGVALLLSEAGLPVRQAALLVGYAAVMREVYLLARVVPTGRALRVEPTVEPGAR